MPTAPAGPLSKSKDRARALLASCATFISDSGAASAAAAYSGYTYRNSLDAPADGKQYTKTELETARPFALAFLPEDQPYRVSRTTQMGAAQPSETGTIYLAIERDVASGDLDDPAEAQTKFENFIGSVITEMLDLSNTDDANDLVGDGASFLIIDNIEVVEMWRIDENKVNELGDFYTAILAVNWGI